MMLIRHDLVQFFEKLKQERKKNLGIKLYFDFVSDLKLIEVIEKNQFMVKEFNLIKFFNTKTNIMFVANHGKVLQQYLDVQYEKMYSTTSLESPELMRFYSCDFEEKKIIITPEVFWEYYKTRYMYHDIIFHILLGIFFDGFYIDINRYNTLNSTKTCY